MISFNQSVSFRESFFTYPVEIFDSRREPWDFRSAKFCYLKCYFLELVKSTFDVGVLGSANDVHIEIDKTAVACDNLGGLGLNRGHTNFIICQDSQSIGKTRTS